MNTEVVQRLVDAWNAGDLSLWLDLFDEHVVWIPVSDHPDPEPLHGREGALAFAEQWLEPWDAYEITTEEIEELGDVVVWTARHRAHRRDSGHSFDVRMTAVYAFRQGRVAQVQWFWDRTDALAAAGRVA